VNLKSGGGPSEFFGDSYGATTMALEGTAVAMSTQSSASPVPLDYSSVMLLQVKSSQSTKEGGKKKNARVCISLMITVITFMQIITVYLILL
jgi:hypothetical protein